MFLRILKSNFVRSSAIYSLTNFLVSVAGYLLNLLIARTFSLTDYGEYMTAMAYLFFLSVPLGVFGLLVMKRIGVATINHKETVALLLENWLFSEIKNHKFLILFLGSIFSLLLYFQGNMSFLSTLFIFAFSVLFIFFNFYLSVLQAYKLFVLAGFLTISAFGMRFVFSLGVIVFNPSLLWLFLVFILANLAGLIIGHRLIKISNQPQKLKIDFQSVLTYVKRPNILIPLLTTLGLAGLINADMVLVKKFFSGEMAGLYGSISLLGKIIFYLAAPLTLVGFSFFTDNKSKPQADKILLLLTLVISLLGLSSIGFYALFPSLIVKVVFGNKFLEVSSLVWLTAVFGSLYSLIKLYAQYFIDQGKNFGLWCLGANLLQAVLIYFYHSSLSQVLLINVGVCGGLLILLMGKVIFHSFYFFSKT